MSAVVKRPGTPPAVSEGDGGVWHNRFMTLLDRIPVPTAICHPDGQVISANPAFAQVWGASRTTVRGQQVTDLIEPAEGAARDALIEALHCTKPSRRPLRVRWISHGALHTGELTVEPVNDRVYGDVPLVLFLHADTDQKGHRLARRAERHEMLPIELHILTLIAAGETTAATARAVGLTVDGVNYHLRRLCRRFDAANRTALIARAYTAGLFDPAAWPPRPAP